MIEKLAQFTDIRCCLVVGGLSMKVYTLLSVYYCLESGGCWKHSGLDEESLDLQCLFFNLGPYKFGTI